jgi:hypothetical protein
MNYVNAGYLITIVGMALYGASLWWRRTHSGE